MKFMYFIEKHINLIYNHFFCCSHTNYCVGIVSVTSASRYVTSASRYQSRTSMYIRGLIPRNRPRQVRLVVKSLMYYCNIYSKLQHIITGQNLRIRFTFKMITQFDISIADIISEIGNLYKSPDEW